MQSQFIMGNNKSRNPIRVLLCLCFGLIVNSAMAVTATVKGSLPSVLVESSGLDWNGGSSFWTMNDTYGDNHLYRVSSTGSLKQTITVNGAANRNWEDLAHDVN